MVIDSKSDPSLIVVNTLSKPVDDKLCVLESIRLASQDFNYHRNKVSEVMYKYDLSTDNTKTVILPTNWKVLEGLVHGDIVDFVTYRADLDISVDSNRHTSNLKDYFQKETGTLGKPFGLSTSNAVYSDVTLSGSQALQVNYDFGVWKTMTILTIITGKVYRIDYNAYPEHYLNQLQNVQHMVSSFTVS